MKVPEFFRDEMMQGDFISFKHDDYFDTADEGTIMSDIIKFKSPYGILGIIFNKIYLTSYLKSLTIKRNVCIR